jgi:hypothetical protein
VRKPFRLGAGFSSCNGGKIPVVTRRGARERRMVAKAGDEGVPS